MTSLGSTAGKAGRPVVARWRRAWLAALVVIVLAGSGCTNAPQSDSRPTTERAATTTIPGGDPPTSAEVSPSTSADTAAPPQPGSVADYEALWRRQRQTIIDDLNGEDYGVGADGVVRGPGGFSLDTTACPDDWSETQGIDAGTITLVQLAPLSAFTTVGELGLGTRHYFEQLNAHGGIGPDGLQVDVVVMDDGYVPEHTAQIVDELVGGSEPFALSTIGTNNLDAVNDLLNEECVPVFMGGTISPISADPHHHPWTTGLRMAQSTEALLWAAWIERNTERPLTVAALVMDNTFGRTYEQAFAEAAATTVAIERFDAIRHDPAAPTVASEMAQIAELEPDVFISMTAGNPCLLAIQEAAEVDLAQHATIRFTPSACANSNAYLKPADLGGQGWLVMDGGMKDPTADEWADDPWIRHVNDALEVAGIDPSSGQQAEGYGLRGWAMHQVLEIAAGLDGGVTRSNLVLAQRGLTEMTHPMLHPGVSFGMNGGEDAYFIEGSQLARYDAEQHRWQVVEVIDLNGRTPTCRWQPDTGCSATG